MPFAIPAFVKTLWSLRYLILSVVVIGAFTWYTVHERNIGAAKCLAAVEQATAQEHERRITIEAYMQQWVAGSINHVNQVEATYAKARQQIARLSRDGDSCLRPDVVEWLRSIRRPEAGH